MKIYSGNGLEKLSYAVIGHAMRTHSELGPGLDEIFYHKFLSAKLSAAGIAHEYKPKGRLIHRGLLADEFQADMIVDRRLIPELKALAWALTGEHYVQLLCYLKYWSIETGLLMDFGKESLVVKRVLRSYEDSGTVDISDWAAALAPRLGGLALVRAVADMCCRLFTEYGLGYRDTTYRGLVRADLMAEGIPFLEYPSTLLDGSGLHLGKAVLDCFVIDHSLAIRVLALRESIRAADRAVMQTYLKHLGLPAGFLVNFGKRCLEVKPVTAPAIRGCPESAG